MIRETKNLEFKEEITKTFLKTVSAFANYGTGQIIFGVTDDKTVKGLTDLEESCLTIENMINDNMNPVPDYQLDTQSDNTICLTVEEGPFKPYLYKNKAYKRHDSSSVEVGIEELKRLILEGMNQTFEQQTSTKQDLTFNELEKTMIYELKIEKLTKDILKTLELLNTDDKYNNAAALLADNNQFKGIDIMRFGNSISEIRDRRTLDNQSILTLFHKGLDVYLQYYQYEIIEGATREKKSLIPEKAFREALANALIHRLWDINASIKISMFDNRIEISSPGSLTSDISVEEYLNGQVSVFRNPIIGNLFYRLNYIEKFGTGIMRIKEAYEDSFIKPKFQVFENSILVILPVIYGDANQLSKEEESIVQCLRKNGTLSRSQIDEMTGMNKEKTVRTLNKLIENQMVIATGKGKGTKYKLNQ